jgi:hypothetical protein|tara:strand:- start:582 stop:1061 length:480 start_codon:yes stop_codon:yes gene_type:complete
MANINYGTSDKYLFFRVANDNSICVRADKLLAMRKKSAAALSLIFDGSVIRNVAQQKLETAGAIGATDTTLQTTGNIEVVLAVATGLGPTVFKDIVNAINTGFSGDDPAWARSADASGFITVADSQGAGEFLSASITACSSINVDRRSLNDESGNDLTP